MKALQKFYVLQIITKQTPILRVYSYPSNFEADLKWELKAPYTAAFTGIIWAKDWMEANEKAKNEDWDTMFLLGSALNISKAARAARS